MIHSWSFSRLSDFESCKFRAFLKYVKKIPEPERPLPPGKKEHTNDRGTRIHEAAEHYVGGLRPDIIPELESFTTELRRLRALYKDGKVSMEGEWGYDSDWSPFDWKKAWLRVKLDVIVHVSPTEAVVIDHKSGHKFGNEIKHGQQLQLYTLSSFMRFPELERVTTELWYVDQDDITSMTFTRPQGLRFRQHFETRGRAMTSCSDFPPNPNVHTCKWCQYGPWNGNHCTVGVQAFKGIPIKKG